MAHLRRNPESALEFVRIWQNAETVQEAAKRFGITVSAATSRASFYRQKGVALKKFSSTPLPFDWDALAKLAEEEAPK